MIEIAAPIIIIVIVLIIVYCFCIHWDTTELNAIERKNDKLFQIPRPKLQKPKEIDRHGPADSKHISLYRDTQCAGLVVLLEAHNLPTTVNLDNVVPPHLANEQEISTDAHEIMSIDAGVLPVRITLYNADHRPIGTRDAEGRIPYMFGPNGIFPESMRFAAKSGYIRIALAI